LEWILVHLYGLQLFYKLEGGIIMYVYLVQHAEAKSKQEDPERPLTEKGRHAIESVARSAARLGLKLGQIRHSGKTRAEETALVLAGKLNPDKGMSPVSGLGPLDDVKPVAEELAGVDDPVMLVGHLPFMERMVGQLVTGNPELPVVNFQNGAIVCLTRNDERWQVSWILTPEMAQALRDQ
jgi:phosphohistidine phosphatase